MQNRLFSLDDQGMTGVMPALETHHGVRTIGEQVYNLTFAFISPLGAYDYDILAHADSLSMIQLACFNRRQDPSVTPFLKHFVTPHIARISSLAWKRTNHLPPLGTQFIYFCLQGRII